jgi:hypothetical protein
MRIFFIALFFLLTRILKLKPGWQSSTAPAAVIISFLKQSKSSLNEGSYRLFQQRNSRTQPTLTSKCGLAAKYCHNHKGEKFLKIQKDYVNSTNSDGNCFK